MIDRLRVHGRGTGSFFGPGHHAEHGRAEKCACPLSSGTGGWLALLVFGLSACGCASYHIGNQSLYPCDIHTVYVPMVESNSFRRDLGERLTEAIVKEIERTTPYKVVNSSHADSVLTVRLVSDDKRVVVPSLTGNAEELQVSVKVQVSWVDRHGRQLRDNKAVPLPSEITDVTGTSNLVAEVGHSVATAQQEAICRVAEQIVGLMEKPW